VRELKLSRPTLACIGLCVVILVVAAADYAHVDGQVPDPSGCQSVGGCLIARLEKAEHLEDQYAARVWVYAFGMLACAALAAAYALRARPRKEWPRIFTNLGVLGVWAAIGATGILLFTGDAGVSIRAAPALTVPIILLATAAAGTLVGRSEGWAEETAADGVRARATNVGKLAIHIGTGGAGERSRLESLGRWFRYTALGLTALAALFTIIVASAQHDCSIAEGPPHWTDPFGSAAAVAGVTAIAAGIGALVLRRWIAALISLVVNPIAFLLLLASTCAFY
jgi:hypothetical protein